MTAQRFFVLSDRSFPLAAAAILLLQAVLTLLHQPWLDEWQALMIAVQSPDPAALLENLSYEGHPPLWYLVLQAAEALVGPRWALPAAAVVLGLTTQALILFRSPFAPWLRLLIALSELILFEFNTISRSYTLGIMLTFLTLACWQQRRWVWLPVILLPLVDFYFGVFSVIFIVLRLRQRAWWMPGLIVWAMAGALAAWSVLPAPDNIPGFIPSQHSLVDAMRYFFRLSAVMLPLQWDGGPQWDKLPPAMSYLVLWLPLLVICLDQTRGRPLDRAALFGFMGIQLLFFLLLHPLTNRQVMLTGVLLIALQWLQTLEGHAAGRPFRLWLLIVAACGVLTAAINLAIPFDTARQVATRIEARGLSGKSWVSYPAILSPPVTAWSGISFERVEGQCEQEFVRWNYQNRFGSGEALRHWATSEARRNGRFYLLARIPLREDALLKRLDRIGAGYIGHPYYIYEVGPGWSDRPLTARPCAPGMLPWRAAQ